MLNTLYGRPMFFGRGYKVPENRIDVTSKVGTKVDNLGLFLKFYERKGTDNNLILSLEMGWPSSTKQTPRTPIQTIPQEKFPITKQRGSAPLSLGFHPSGPLPHISSTLAWALGGYFWSLTRVLDIAFVLEREWVWRNSVSKSFWNDIWRKEWKSETMTGW